MMINGLAFPNPDFGYETTIKLPFYYSRLGNGKTTVRDEGRQYDSYAAKCSCVMPRSSMDEFHALYDESGRGGRLTLSECRTSGFYPFTPAALSVDGLEEDAYSVTLSNINQKGAVDLLAKGFRVDFEMLLGFDEGVVQSAAQPARPEGSMSMSAVTINGGVAIDGIRYPVSGFAPSVGYNVYSRHMLGGGVETINYDYHRGGKEPKSAGMTITATEAAANGIIQALLFNIRANKFTITAPDGYHLFGRGTGEFDVRLNSAELKVKHTRFDEFEIILNVVEA